uniref:Uncharacterized protein n=1 Tax=Moniliophthora roreri TaxID=221103 RepID=A0A0W0FC03_MONRR
MNEKTFRRF